MESRWPSSVSGSVAFLVTLIIMVATFGYLFKHLPHTFVLASSSNAHDTKAGVRASGAQITPTPDKGEDTHPAVYSPQQEEIVAYVKEVFGKDADKALQVLSCENHALNPKAINDNTLWGGIGVDKGLFQINTSWQGVTNDHFLYDWKINTLMAKTIFDDWGHNFQAWTCGKKMGL